MDSSETPTSTLNQPRTGSNFGGNHENVDAKNQQDFDSAVRSTFLRIDLDAISENLRVLKGHCGKHTEVIAVVKANAYGHGAVGVTHHLRLHGLRHFAVATVAEGIELRRAGVDEFIQILGTACQEEIRCLQQHDLTPTVATPEFIKAWNETWSQSKNNMLSDSRPPPITIKVDTGMCRNGCLPEDLEGLMRLCRDDNLPVHSIMTHFAQSWDHPDFTQKQLYQFLDVTRVYREQGMKVHVANSAAILNGYGTDLDYVRPGIVMYGEPPFHFLADNSNEAAKLLTDLGLRPALTWIAKPTIVKCQRPGSVIGYGRTYRRTLSRGGSYLNGCNQCAPDGKEQALSSLPDSDRRLHFSEFCFANSTCSRNNYVRGLDKPRCPVAKALHITKSSDGSAKQFLRTHDIVFQKHGVDSCHLVMAGRWKSGTSKASGRLTVATGSISDVFKSRII
ncbi:hypothetical protein ScPMuIL_003963 [Solemya velum]